MRFVLLSVHRTPTPSTHIHAPTPFVARVPAFVLCIKSCSLIHTTECISCVSKHTNKRAHRSLPAHLCVLLQPVQYLRRQEACQPCGLDHSHRTLKLPPALGVQLQSAQQTQGSTATQRSPEVCHRSDCVSGQLCAAAAAGSQLCIAEGAGDRHATTHPCPRHVHQAHAHCPCSWFSVLQRLPYHLAHG
jgi:hypothetical protein